MASCIMKKIEDSKYEGTIENCFSKDKWFETRLLRFGKKAVWDILLFTDGQSIPNTTTYSPSASIPGVHC